MATLSPADDRQFWIPAVQTVLLQMKDRLGLDPDTIKEISEDVARKAGMFKFVNEEMERDSENKRKMWEKMLRKLSDEALLESYENAIRLRLEQAFIDMLAGEIKSRGLSLSAVSNVVPISS